MIRYNKTIILFVAISKTQIATIVVTVVTAVVVMTVYSMTLH